MTRAWLRFQHVTCSDGPGALGREEAAAVTGCFQNCALCVSCLPGWWMTSPQLYPDPLAYSLLMLQ
jgi:hypothetical protein